jgi:hypothetical protein
MSFQSNMTFDPAVKYQPAPLGYLPQPEWKLSLRYLASLGSYLALAQMGSSAASHVSHFKPWVDATEGWGKRPGQLVQLAYFVLGLDALSSWSQNGNGEVGLERVKEVFSFFKATGINSTLAYLSPCFGMLLGAGDAFCNLYSYVREEGQESLYQASFYRYLFMFGRALINMCLFVLALTCAHYSTTTVAVGSFALSKLSL